MALPTSADVHVDSALTNISIAFMQNASNFVASRVFPNVPVDKQSDKYFTIDRGDFNRNTAKVRAPGTKASQVGFKVDSNNTYFADVRASRHDIPLQTLANADAALNLEQAGAQLVTHQLLIEKEVDWTSSFFTTGVWTTDVTGVASSPASGEVIQWSDATSSDPIGDIRTAIDTIEESTGFTPNTLVLGKQVFSALIDNPDIVDRVKYSGGVGNANPASVNEQTLAQLFGLDRVMISRAIQNTAAEGLTNSHSFIAGKNALLTYVPENPGLLTPTGGYTFSWRGFLNQTNDFGMATKRYSIDELEAEVIEGQMAYDHKLVSGDLGYFWSSIAA